MSRNLDAHSQSHIRVLIRVLVHKSKNTSELFSGGHAFCEDLLNLNAPVSAGFFVSLNEEHGGPSSPRDSCLTHSFI